ncbi:MAG: AI-2E family transporter [Candidatus Liptonbacteria bacterium]|nr:AI-2E family transporter [Candidatus Liptonbacteria bacterium]
MPRENNKSHYFYFAILLGALAMVGAILLPFLTVLVFAVTFAVVFYPLHRRLLRTLPAWPGVAAFLSSLLVIVVVLIPLTALGISAWSEAGNLYAKLTQQPSGTMALGGVAGRVQELLPPSARAWLANSPVDADRYIAQVLDWLVQKGGQFFSGATQFVFGFVLMLIALYYCFKDGARLARGVVELCPLAPDHTRRILERLRQTVVSVVLGSLVVALVQGILAGIGFTLFGLPQAAIWGLVTVAAALLPVLGTPIVTVPASLYLIWTGNLVNGVGLLAWSLLIVALIDNVLRPFIIRRGVDLHPLFILLGVLGGITFFGPAGFLLGPIAVAFLFVLLDLYPELAHPARECPAAHPTRSSISNGVNRKSGRDEE